MLELRDNLFWCECAGRAVFLDVAEDRYFCLPTGTNDAFLRFARSASTDDDRARLAFLVEQGVLVERHGAGFIRRPPLVVPPAADWPVDPGSRPGFIALARAFYEERRAARRLRTWPFADAITWARHHERPARTGAQSDHSLETIVGAAAAVSLLLRAHDRCLVRALAVQSICRGKGVATQLVVGVIGHPFAAHCWVQLGDKVLVGAFEQARLYTPILVVE